MSLSGGCKGEGQERMKRQLRSISMVIAFLVGGIFHKEIAPLTWFLPIGIAFMLSITFVGIDTKRLRPSWMHLWLLLAIEVIGLGAWGLALACGRPILAESLYYCGAAPVAAASPIIVNLLRGDLEFSTTAMLLSQAVFAVLTPFILPFVVHEPTMGYVEFMGVVAGQIASVMVAPAVISIGLRWVYPPSKEWAPKLADVSLAAWCINLTIISASGTQRILEMGYSWQQMVPMALGALVICIIGFVGGYWLGYPKLKRECSQGLGQKNTVLTLYIAGQPYATPLAYIGPVFYVFFHNMANAVQLALAERERARQER